MREAMRVQRVGHAVPDIVAGALVQVVAGRFPGYRWRDMPACVEIVGRVARQQRSAVDAVPFHCDPVRSNIPLFEYVNTHPRCTSDLMHRPVDRTAVAKQKHIRHSIGRNGIAIPRNQAFGFVAIVPSAFEP